MVRLRTGDPTPIGWSRVGHERGGMARHRTSATSSGIRVIPGIMALADTGGHQRPRVEAEFEPPSLTVPVIHRPGAPPTHAYRRRSARDFARPDTDAAHAPTSRVGRSRPRPGGFRPGGLRSQPGPEATRRAAFRRLRRRSRCRALLPDAVSCQPVRAATTRSRCGLCVVCRFAATSCGQRKLALTCGNLGRVGEI